MKIYLTNSKIGEYILSARLHIEGLEETETICPVVNLNGDSSGQYQDVSLRGRAQYVLLLPESSFLHQGGNP